jgi:hypothetical protein
MSSRIERDFSAVLKTPDGRVLEYGTARASIQEGEVDFQSEFVPLFKMGTPLVVVRMKDKVETQVFTGESYLSTEKMLRLVSVRDEVLPGAASVYSYDVDLPGQASALIQPKIHRRLFSFGQKEEPIPAWQEFPVSVYALSLSQVKFTCQLPLTQGQRLTLTAGDPPLLQEVPLEVELPVTFGEGDTSSYRCRILELPGENRPRMEALLRQLSLALNKAFPPPVVGELPLAEQFL